MKRLAIVCTLMLLMAVPAMSQQIEDDFWITVGSGTVLDGGGSGYNDGTWYVYPSMWINQWYYDHPYDPLRGKIVHVEFDYIAIDTTCTTDINVAINWSTPEWSALGHGDELPPLPGEDEELYIVRVMILDECTFVTELRHFEYDYIIYDYNPEWVSIDVRGCNFEITDGVIVHECALGTQQSSWSGIKANFR